MRLIKAIMTLVLGYKYRVVILKDRGAERYWVCSYVFEDTECGRRRLDKYLEGLEESVVAHVYWETVSFRSRKPYGGILAEKLRMEEHTHDMDNKKLREYVLGNVRKYARGEKEKA